MRRLSDTFRIPPARTAIVACEAALLLYFGALWVIAYASDQTVAQAWRHLGVHSYEPPFLDLSVVAEAIAHARPGVSPYAPGEHAAALPAYNYPRLWLAWGAIGLSPQTVWLWGVATAVGFWTASLVLLRPRTFAQAATVALLWWSPAFMIGVERANTDLVVFAVVVAALLAHRRFEFAGAAGLLLAAAAKLYPIAAAVALLARRGLRSWVAFGAVLAGFAVYAGVFRADLRLISQHTPRDVAFSYGCAIPLQLGGLSYSIAYVAGALTATGLAAGALRYARGLPALPDSSRPPFIAGASLYCGTFLLGNNYEYRLVFLQLCLPALWSWAGATDRRARRFAGVIFALSAVTCWWDFLRRFVPHPLHSSLHLCTFALFATLAAALASALLQPRCTARPARGWRWRPWAKRPSPTAGPRSPLESR